MRATTFSAQVSTSRAVPRSSRIRNPLPPKRPQRSFAVSCMRTASANWPMKSSLASTPIALWISAKRSGLTYANWRTPPFMALRTAVLDGGEQIALLQKARRGVVLHRVRELQLEIVIGALVVRRDADARRRLVLVVGPREGQRERYARSVGEQRLHLERVIRPFALQARHQRPLQRGMRLRLEQIHQGRAGERILARVAEQLEPRSVGIDDDAFLHVSDRVGGALEESLQLLAILARRGERARERPLEAMCAQLAGHHRLQAAAVGERHHVLRARAHRVGDDGLVDLLAHDHDRHLGGALLLDLHERAHVDAELLDEGDEQLRVELRDGIR